ncbi:MAG: hypothetical protein IKH16_10740 [Selenomonadaceae bacterium]|nr:hypothetical protein [Selenomonadaceae bacterium]
MLRMNEIKQEGNKITCRVFPENKENRAFHMSIDATTLEYECEGREHDDYSGMALGKIMDYLDEGKELPEEAYSYWY